MLRTLHPRLLRRHLSGRWLRWLLGQVLLGSAFFVLGALYASPQQHGVTDVRHAREAASHVFLVVMVMTAPNNVDRRMAIRNTWLASHDGRSNRHRAFFVVGTKDISEASMTALKSEAVAHGDLLTLPSVEDSYNGLTDKVLTALATIDEDLDFNYLLKVDDDTFVNLPRLVQELENSNYKDGLYWGFFDGRAPVMKSGKWAETKYLLCDRYLPYALGGGYVLSANLVNYLARNADDLEQWISEDVSMGTWLAPVREVHRVHDSRFDTEWTSRGCKDDYLVTHKQSVKDMDHKHANLRKSDFLVMCDKEFTKRMSYEYNWSAPPSKCCKRG